MGMLKFNGSYVRVGIPSAEDMDFKFAYVPLIVSISCISHLFVLLYGTNTNLYHASTQFTQKKIAGSIVTGTRRMKRMLQMTTDELSTYGAESDEWNAKVVPFDTVNEVMDDLLNGRNTNNWRYVLTW